MVTYWSSSGKIAPILWACCIQCDKEGFHIALLNIIMASHERYAISNNRHILFVQQLVQASNNKNYRAPHYWSFVVTTVRYPTEKVSDEESVPIPWRHIKVHGACYPLFVDWVQEFTHPRHRDATCNHGKVILHITVGEDRGVWTPCPRGSPPPTPAQFFLPTPAPFFPYFFRVPPPKSRFFAPAPRPSGPRPRPFFVTSPQE